MATLFPLAIHNTHTLGVLPPQAAFPSVPPTVNDPLNQDSKVGSQGSMGLGVLVFKVTGQLPLYTWKIQT